MRRLLFLDVDGVLNTERSTKFLAISNGPLERLRQIVKDTGCEIVLSSTWRKIDRAKQELTRAFERKGIPLWIGETPQHADGFRGKEIDSYMMQNFLLDAHYAILDDDSDMLPHQLPHFFQTDPEFGLTKNIAYRVTYHLTNGKGNDTLRI